MDDRGKPTGDHASLGRALGRLLSPVRRLLLLCLLAAPLFALNPERPAGSYSIQGWFTEQGLPSNKIRAIEQTRDGYLWLATAQGIARFDGSRFTTFNSTSHPTLRGTQFFAVQEAPDGSLWFGGEAGLFRWRDGSFEHFTTEHGLPHNFVRGLALTRDGAIVACTRRGYSFVREGRIHSPGGIWKQTRGVARSYLERTDGSIFLGTAAGLWRITGDKIEQLSGEGKLSGTGFMSLREGPDGSVWIGCSDGVHRLFPDGRSESFGEAQGLVNAHVAGLQHDRDGNLWIAAAGSLYRLTNGQLQAAPYEESFRGTPLHGVHEDREGGLWIATVTGLFRLKDAVSTRIGAPEGLEQTSVYSVFEAADGAWWFGLWYGGVYRYDGTRAVRVPALAALDQRRVYSFAQTPNGDLWIGAESGLYRHAGGTVTNFFQAEEAPRLEKQLAERPDALLPRLAHYWINALASDKHGGLWIASEGALYHQVAGGFRAYTTADGLPSNYFYSVLCARNGDIWAGNSDSVVRRRDGRWSVFGRESVAAGHINSLYEDETGAIWVATDGGGLSRFKDGRWKTYSAREGLADNSIRAVVEDGLGFVWLAYPRGIMRIARREFDEIEAGRRTTLQPQIFNQADGLPRGEINAAGNPNAWRTRGGQLLFATDIGVAVVAPRQVTLNALAPPVVIERLLIDGVAADLSREVRVPPGRNDLRIQYTAISLPAPEKVQFKIRLAPLDRDWVDSGNLRDVRYAQLPAGRYTFHVKASNNDGVWNERGASLAFEVRPSFHQTGWFAGLLIVLGGAAVFAIIFVRARLAQRQMIALEQLVGERTRQLQVAKDAAEAAVAEHRRAETELRWKTALLEAQMEAAPDGILVVDNHGRLVLRNRRFAAMWKLPPELPAAGDDARILEFVVSQLKDPAGFVSKIRALYASEAESFDLLEFTDGRVFERYSQPQRVDGRAVGRVWCFRDVTERRRAEKELQLAHRQLVDASRRAGMAEVATGVLHNVGNVLNSVNVSATLVTDVVRGSRIGNVKRLADLLAENQGDLARFLATDPRGQQIPAFLQTLSTRLQGEQADVLQEVESLRKNVEHIKDIVARQQSYARVSGVSEDVQITELVEDALRMNEAGLARHDVTVVREFEASPLISTEKHKVLQVLVNLMRNAKHACDDSGRVDKRMTVRVHVEAGWLKIAVSDNGVGIPPENLTRIFSHGFTTRSNGHGFGLHSGALAAKELGGTLLARSEGPGCGAVFTLELPMKQEAKAA